MKANFKYLSQKNGEEGYVLLSVYFMAAILTIFSLALFTRAYLFIQHSERNQNRIIAFNMADTGVSKAMRGLVSNTSYSGESYTAQTKGGYSSSVSTPSSDYGTATTDSTVRYIQSSGFAPTNVTTDRAYETRSVDAYVKLDTTPFEFAAFGDNSLILNGTPYVDSYDSRNGAYGGSNTGADGDVASDGTITFIGNPTVLGDTVQNPNIECGPASTTLPSSGSLNINGSQNYQLAAGTYHFDSISITGSGKLTLLGPVTIYVDGTVYVGGNGVVTSGNDPKNFMLYGTGSGAINIAGTSTFYGAVYAPAADVTYTGTEDNFGAVIAKTYQQSGTSALHYDEALKDVTAPCTQVTLLSWKENKTALQGS